MGLLYASALRTTRITSVKDAIDINASPAYIELCTASYALVCATITFAKPSFTVSGDVATLAGVPKSTTDAAASGTATIARIKDGGGNTIVSEITVGAGSGMINLNSNVITQHQTVTLTAGTITHPT